MINQLKLLICIKISEYGRSIRAAERYSFYISLSWLIRNGHFPISSFFLLLLLDPHLLLQFSIILFIYFSLHLSFLFNFFIKIILLFYLNSVPLSLYQIYLFLLFLLIIMTIKSANIISIFNQNITISLE